MTDSDDARVTLYPKPLRRKKVYPKNYPWRVEYDLRCFDRHWEEQRQFTEFYKTALRARIDAFFWVKINSLGGTAVLIRQHV